MPIEEIEEGSGNVFADLGLPNPDECLVKADIAIRANKAIRQKHLSQDAAAKLLNISETDVSNLSRGLLKNFSVDQLMRFLSLLGAD